MERRTRNKAERSTVLSVYSKKQIRRVYLLDDKSPFSVVEAFRNIATNLSFSCPKPEDGGARKIFMSSSNPAEGKTTVVVNLAYTLAKSKAKVLLIDCDLRKPRINRYFGVERHPGISDFVSGQDIDETKLVHRTHIEGLDIITSGTIPPNPIELLTSKMMEKTLEVFSKEYDYILFDTPPINHVADTLALAPLTDGGILVIRAKQSNHTCLAETLRQLEFVGCKIFGTILNGQDEKESGYGYKRYGYGRKYKYYYYKKEYKYADSNADLEEESKEIKESTRKKNSLLK
ncbi:MAG: CpsD/CapB family tyrosine-protein kinase [Bacillota bacterium]